MKRALFLLQVLLTLLCVTNLVAAQQPAQDTKPQDHSGHAGVNERGDHAMGFSHLKSTHHFLLRANGGLIEVSANDAKDTESRDQIRGHLGHIARLFAGGDFNIPMFIHDKMPPGAETMARLKSEISYTF